MLRLSLLFAFVAALVAVAPGSSAPERRIASYCSPSGDVCFGIFDNAQQVIRFELTTVERYFSRYRLCVNPPRGATTCRSFPVRRSGQVYGGSVIWLRNFPERGSGVYRVTWKLGTRPLGRTLSFRQA